MDAEAHELIAGYALDALDEADRARAKELLATSEEAREERPESEPRPDEAAPGNTGGERVPDASPQESAPEVPAAPKPAPTRPAGSSPEIAL